MVIQKDELSKWRKEINILDKTIVDSLKNRFEITKKIGKYKLKNKLSVVNKKRELEIIDFWTKKTKFKKKFVKRFFNVIFEESKRLQRSLK